MEKIAVFLGAVLLGLVLIIVGSLLLAFPTMWLWDYLMPTLFKLKEITIYQAIALNVLSGILFKSSSNKSESKK